MMYRWGVALMLRIKWTTGLTVDECNGLCKPLESYLAIGQRELETYGVDFNMDNDRLPGYCRSNIWISESGVMFVVATEDVSRRMDGGRRFAFGIVEWP